MSSSSSGVSLEDISDILRKKYAIFTGAHDKEFRSLIVFPDVHSEPLPDEPYLLLLQYFASLPATHAPVRDFAVLIDRRTSDWNSVKLVVSKLNRFPISGLKHIYVLKPQGLLQRFFVERTIAWIRDDSKFPVHFVDKTTELLPFIDPAHLPTDIGGDLSFNVDDWIRDRLSIESFRKKVHCLCNNECFLMNSLHQNASSTSLNEMDLCSGSAYICNPCYTPITFYKLRKKRRQWLDRVVALEMEGLQLRQVLRNTTEPLDSGAIPDVSPSEKEDGSDTSVWANKGTAFDLPVDRVFHVITLEHILVRLTETHAKCSSHWRQYARLFQTVKLMASVEKRFLEHQPLLGIWENLLESALDYRLDHLPAIYQEANPLNPADSVSYPTEDEPLSSEQNHIDIEALQSVLNRLREADQFASHLVSDLSALSQTSKWLISCVLEANLRTPAPPASLGIASPTLFHLDSDSDSDSQLLSDVPDTLDTQQFALPPLVLPENSKQWPILFDRLLHLAKTRLPQSVDQLSRLYELHCEISNSPERVPPLVDHSPSSSDNEFVTSPGVLDRSTSVPTDHLADPVRRFNLAWDELLETERAYVSFLNHVYDVVWLGNLTGRHMPESKNGGINTESVLAPPFMSNNQSWLLANWPDLLYFHRDYLLPGLEECHNDSTRLKYWALQAVPRLTDLYSVYCSMHPNTVHAAMQLERDRSHSAWLTACSEEVHRRETVSSSNGLSFSPDPSLQPVLQLSARLVTPVQRFQRYHLLTNQLLRLALTETDRAELAAAHKSLVEMCETVNLAMRFRGLSMRPSEMGQLLLHADFNISRDDSRTNQQRHAFLFTNAILLTKFRNYQTSSFPTRIGSLIPPPSCTESSSDGRERSGSSYYLSGIPLASNLASLVKAHGSSSSGDSGPVYEIRDELPLAQIGLTPNVRADRRRFAVWTANRAQTYIFYTTDTTCRDHWVRSINDLLMDQLRRLRDEALKRHLPQRTTPPVSNLPESTLRAQYNRSNSLPVYGETDTQRMNNAKNFYLSLPSSTRKK